MEKLSKHLPIISAFIIFIGFLKLHLFYRHFGIDIINYISTNEILTSFLDDINILILIIGVMFLHLLFGVCISKNIESVSKHKKEYIYYRFIRLKFRKKRFHLSLLLTSIFIICFSVFKNYYCMYLLLFFIYALIANIFDSVLKIKDPTNYHFLVISIILLLVSSLCLSKIDIYCIINRENNIELHTKSNIIHLTKNDLFIGKTAEYYFIKKNNETIIYPKSEIISIKFKSNNNTMTHKTINDKNFKIEESDNKYQYQKELTKKLDSITTIDQNILNEIILWKVNRYADFSDEIITKLNAISINDKKEKKKQKIDEDKTREILKLLLYTKGVRLPMASTILRFINPNIYQIIDQRVFRLLYKDNTLKYTGSTSDKSIENQIEIYLKYLTDLRNACTKLGIDFKESDRILYMTDKRINSEHKINY